MKILPHTQNLNALTSSKEYMKGTSQLEGLNLFRPATELLVCYTTKVSFSFWMDFFICNATLCFWWILGFVKFLGPYYMVLITKRRKVGMICGHAVYAITKSEMFPIPNSTVLSNMDSKNENRSFVNSACKCKMSIVLLRRHYNGNNNTSSFFVSLWDIILVVVVSFLFCFLLFGLLWDL